MASDHAKKPDKYGARTPDKIMIYGVVIVVSVAVGLFVIIRILKFSAENGDNGPLPQSKKMLDDIEEVHQTKADTDESVAAYGAFVSGNINSCNSIRD